MPVQVERVVDSLSRSAESPSLTLTLEEGKDVALPDGSLDVADQGSVDGTLELNLNLRDTTPRAYRCHKRAS